MGAPYAKALLLFLVSTTASVTTVAKLSSATAASSSASSSFSIHSHLRALTHRHRRHQEPEMANVPSILDLHRHEDEEEEEAASLWFSETATTAVQEKLSATTDQPSTSPLVINSTTTTTANPRNETIHQRQVRSNPTSSLSSYLDILSNETTAEQSLRFLQSLPQAAGEEGPYFSPLECNDPACPVNTTWTEQDYRVHRGTVVIPCGTCVWMDFESPDQTLILPHGLDVQGHLYIPDGYKLTVETPFVIVQGLLEINSTAPVGEEPWIKFNINGDRRSVAFLPAHNNAYVCPTDQGFPGECDIGFRAIAVAGGKVNIRGLPEGTTTWTQLHDIVQVPKASEPRHRNFTKLPELDPFHHNPYCRFYDPYINDTFSKGPGDWTAGYGVYPVVHDRKFRVLNRKSDTEHAPTVDMLAFHDCLIPGQEYLFSARIRLWDPDQPRLVRTPCAFDGETNCLQLYFATRTASGVRLGRKKHQETQTDTYHNYEWQDFHAKIKFTEKELDPTNTFHILQLRGPQARYNIDLEEVTLSLPHVSLVPDPDNVCGHNLIMNGDAEGDRINPYPMEVSGGRLSIFKFTSTGNQAFRVRYRQKNEDALVYFMDAPNCITTGSRYRVSARVYGMTSKVRVQVVIKYRIFFRDGTSRGYEVAECDPSRFDWQPCKATFAVVDDIDPFEIDRVRFWFETTNAPTADFLVDDFFVELAKPAKSGILVPAEGIDGHWDEGVEVLITSHTTNMEDRQLRRLVHPPVPVEGGLVRLELDDYIVFPVTKQHDEGLFPVEVALLNRNIRFFSPKEESEQHQLLGGHFMVLRTPNVDQHVEGIEFVNFGQQGELGRYPIHIHLCKNAYSVIAKNLVRSSNQRCVVIHGSHNTTISENVAFDTFGHCFITEDGGEFDNKFIRNLGSNQKISKFIVREGESDHTDPSTFWSANPNNEWVGNIAAGSEGSGFWLELLDFVRLPSALLETSLGIMPKRLPLTRFLDNIAHSNYRHGLRMYPHGLNPSTTAKFENFVSYKNRLDGLFFRNMENTVVEGGILADNRVQADFDGKGDTVVMDGTRLIGSTARFREIVQLQNLVGGGYHKDQVIGMELHSFAKNIAKNGLEVRNVVFEGFDQTGSDFTALVQVDPHSDDVWSGVFDFWATFESITIRNNTIPYHFDFSKALASSYKGVYVVDLDSSMKPPSSDATGTSTAIADSPDMRVFMDPTKCSPVEGRGYLYCKNTCIRSITFAVDPGQDVDVRLKIHRVQDGSIYHYEGTQDFLIDDDLDRHYHAMTDMERPLFFSAPLPSGEYKAMFVRGSSNTPIWPIHVETRLEPALCSGSFGSNDVELTVPPPKNSECTELIRNGDLEQSNYWAPFWLQTETHIELARGRGIRFSNALTDTDQTSPLGSLGQYVDVRCLSRGETYLIQAWVRFSENDNFFTCDGGSPSCPDLRLKMFKQEDEVGVNTTEDIIAVSTQYASPVRAWNLLHGIITIDERLEQATRAFVYVQRQRPGIKLYVDNMSMTRLDNQCSELVFNGNLDEDTTVFWEHFNGDFDLRNVQGNNALVLKQRTSSFSSITQRMRTGCMVKGARYLAKARVRLYDRGMNMQCNPTVPAGGKACPRMRIRAFTNYGYGSQPTVGYPSTFTGNTDHGWTSDGWHTITEVLTAGEVEENAGQLILYINGPGEEYDIMVDDVSITPLEEDCSQLILNGDAEAGDTARLWRLFLKSENSTIAVINTGDGNQAFKMTGREYYNDGMAQFIDGGCMKLGTQWKVEAQMKLVSKESGDYVSCIPDEKNTFNSCPAVHLSTIKDGTRVDDGRYFMTNEDPWNVSKFNKYETEFTVTRNVAWGEQYIIGFRNFNSDWDLIIDDISIKPVAA